MEIIQGQAITRYDNNISSDGSSFPQSYKTLVKILDGKFAILEQFEEEIDGKMCEGCEAPCEKGEFMVLLTEAEFRSGKYPFRIVQMPDLEKNFSTQKAIGMALGECGCFFLKDNKCTIYKDRPKACRMYNCKTDPRAKIIEFVKKRFGTK